jgi:hypothetical protein
MLDTILKLFTTTMLVLKNNMLAAFASNDLLELNSHLSSYSSSIEIRLLLVFIFVAGLLSYIYFSGIGQRILDNASKIISIGAVALAVAYASSY